MDPAQSQRSSAAKKFSELVEIEFFRTLCEPVRLQIVAALIEHGQMDITTLAERFAQDRSVISRHLSLLEVAGIVKGEKVGRHRLYMVNGSAIVAQLKKLTAQVSQIVERCGC